MRVLFSEAAEWQPLSEAKWMATDHPPRRLGGCHPLPVVSHYMTEKRRRAHTLDILNLSPP